MGDSFLGDPAPVVDPSIRPVEIIGMVGLFKMALGGGDLEKALQALREQSRLAPDDTGIPIDLAVLYFMVQRAEPRAAAQRSALSRNRFYRVGGEKGVPARPRLRVLALVTEGDPLHNLPVDFILDGSDVSLDLLYLSPDEPFPDRVPEHDVAFAAVSEADETVPLLRRLAAWLSRWPRPVVNDPLRVAALSRDGASAFLGDIPGLLFPPTVRRERPEAARLAAGQAGVDDLFPGARYPLLIRPIGSHAGRNLEKIEAAPALAAYLDKTPGDRFFLAPFIDYRSPDGRHRKYRVAFIDGRPFLCHMALSEHWLIHYINAGMAESAEKRAQEALAMAAFDAGFAVRHAAVFRELVGRVGLDYFGIDCGETLDGRLLIFEVETGMVVHDLDPAYPYKQGQMRRVFGAFRDFLARRSGEAPPSGDVVAG